MVVAALGYTPVGSLGFTPANRNGDTFTGSVGATLFTTIGNNGNVQLVQGDGVHSGYLAIFAPNSGPRQGYVGYAQTNGSIAYNSDTGGVHYFNGGGLKSTGGLQVTGQNVWHAGNLNPGAYAPLSGATFGGDVSANRLFARSNGDGLALAIGDDAWIGDVNLVGGLSIKGQQDSRQGYVTFGNSGIALGCNPNDGTLRYAGNPIWHAGNFDPNSKANRSGDTFAGSVGTSGSNGAFVVNPRNGDGNQWIIYANDANSLFFYRSGIGNLMRLDANGDLRVAGQVYAAGAV